MTDRNAAQEIADDMLTDPDKDAGAASPPAAPQTIDAEPDDAADRGARDER